MGTVAVSPDVFASSSVSRARSGAEVWSVVVSGNEVSEPRTRMFVGPSPSEQERTQTQDTRHRTRDTDTQTQTQKHANTNTHKHKQHTQHNTNTNTYTQHRHAHTNTFLFSHTTTQPQQPKPQPQQPQQRQPQQPSCLTQGCPWMLIATVTTAQVVHVVGVTRGCVHGGDMNSSPSTWSWLQCPTTRLARCTHQDRGGRY